MSSDPQTIEKFKRAVEEEWRDPRVTAGYRKWDVQETAWGVPLRDFLLERAELERGLDVLDIGSAHGEPGIAIAARVNPGRVTLLDLAPDLLEIAAARARRDGLANVATRHSDAHALPFADGTFDRVTSRLVAMYFADYRQAFREALRVLRPRGKAVYLVWGTFDQPMFRDVIGVLFKYVTPPEDEPGAPSPFRFSEPGSLSAALAEAGFIETSEESRIVSTRFPGDPSAWWEWLVDLAAPVQTWLAGMSDADRTRALSEIHEALQPYYDGQVVDLPVQVIAATGRRHSSAI